MSKVKNFVIEFLSLISFFTRIPTGYHNLENAVKKFYLISIIGLIHVLPTYILIIIEVPKLVKGLYVVLTTYLITGFLHLEGFCDFIDALIGGKSKEDRIRILKDKCRGSFAIISVTLLILTYFISILSIENTIKLIQLLTITHVISCESMYILSIISIEEPYEGIAKKFMKFAKQRVNIIKNVLTFMILLLIVHLLTSLSVLYTISALTVVLLATLYTRYLAHKLIGFVNGDIIGFNFEICRTISLLTCSIICNYLNL